MKYLLILITGLFISTAAFADCNNAPKFSVFPGGKTIRQNTIFLVEATHSYAKIISELNTRYPIYLKSGAKKVNLVIIEVCNGMSVSQALLKPETELEAGLSYSVCIDSLKGFKSLYKYSNSDLSSERATYTVIAEKDTEKPTITGSPVVLKRILTHYGCGDSKYVVFSNPSKDKSEILVRTTVKDLKSGNTTTYYLIPDGNQVNVGHGMCGGLFSYDRYSKNYTAEFTFLDASGNKTTVRKLPFTGPTDQNSKTGEP